MPYQKREGVRQYLLVRVTVISVLEVDGDPIMEKVIKEESTEASSEGFDFVSWINSMVLYGRQHFYDFINRLERNIAQ